MSRIQFQLNQKFSVTCRDRGETMAARECLRNLGYEIYTTFDNDRVESMKGSTVSYDLEDIFRGAGKEDLHFETLGDMLAYHYTRDVVKLERIKKLKEELTELEATL